MPEPRFLVVRLGSLGDIVHTFPAVAALRESFPSAEIVWLTHPRWVKLVECSGLATEIWPVDSRNWASVRQVVRRIRGGLWTAGIDYQGLWKSAFLPFLGGVKKRIGFSPATIREYGVPILYTDRVECSAAHIADQNGELSLRAGAAKGCADVSLHVEETDLAVVRSQMEKEGLLRYVVLSPGGGWISKCWPAERFGALARKLRSELGIRCVINSGPGDDALLTAVQTAGGNSEPFAYSGALGPLMALLRNSLCLVGGDTGPLHLAAALGTPVVALFGPTDPARNGPYPRQEIVLRAPNAVTSYRRGNQTDPSLLELSVDAVFAAVKRRLGVAA